MERLIEKAPTAGQSSRTDQCVLNISRQSRAGSALRMSGSHWHSKDMGAPTQSPDSTSGRILVIDDDAELCKLVARFLSAEGFRVETVRTSTQGVERARSGEHELIVLDIMLPGMDGFEILRRLRAESRTPVLMLTARGDDLDRILGLEIGADDYLPKPFNPRELAARIPAILPRVQTACAALKSVPFVF